MTTKTVSSLILAGVLATSAAAAVQVIEPASVSGATTSVRAEAAASDQARLILGFNATAVNQQRPAGVVRITR